MTKLLCKCNSFFIYVLCFLILLCTLPLNKTLAFVDDFTSDPNISTLYWDIQNSNGLTWTNPGLRFSSTNTSSFPYIKSKDSLIPKSDKYYEIKFQFTGTGSPWGVGGSFTDNAPNYPTYLATIPDYLSYNIAYFFGEKLHFVTSLCPSTVSICPYSWWFIYPNPTPSNTYFPQTNVDINPHTFSVLRTDISENIYTYKIFLDSNQILESQPTNRLINSIWLGHPSDLGGNKSWPTLNIYSVRTLTDYPSIFPYVSQKDTRWASEEYDSAKDWAGLEKSGIDRWGCALTSAVMMLQNYGVKAEDGTEIDPAKLNTWLINQGDGYIGPGLINWIAVARYAKDRVPGEKDSLEYVRSYLPSAPILPAILGLPGHFVVAHDEDATNWIINDPASETRKSLPKTSTVKSINRLVPSSTDLSYILLVKDTNVGVSLTQGENTPVALTWDEEYLDDDVEGGAKGTILSAYVPKPNTGKYRISLNNTDVSERTIEIYLYDQDGDVKKQKITMGSGQQIYEINFDKVEVSNSVIAVADTEAPKLSTKTSFDGWYNSPQTAYFTYIDSNLRDDYTDPSCVISTEGKNQSCTINPNVCDQAGNCSTQTQTSNPANIDMTPPNPPRLLWINEYWQRIWLVWNTARDHDRYIVYTGTNTGELKRMGETREKYYISPLLKPGKYYVAISAVDKAGNESPKSKPLLIKIPKR